MDGGLKKRGGRKFDRKQEMKKKEAKALKLLKWRADERMKAEE